jgi:hypothetical protein
MLEPLTLEVAGQATHGCLDFGELWHRSALALGLMNVIAKRGDDP